MGHLPEVKVRVIPVTPTHEVSDFTAIAVTGLLTACAAALGQEPLDQQGVAPDVCAGLGRVIETTDKSQCLSAIHASHDRWQFDRAFDRTLRIALRRTGQDLSACNFGGALPGPVSHLGDKADFTPSPLRVRQQQGLLDGRNERCCSQLRVCSYRAGFSHPPYAPSKPLQPR